MEGSALNNASLHNSTWTYLFTDLADPRTSRWPLMSSPLLVLTILACYLSFVLKFGPNYMKDKKPYSLKKPIMVYNLLQVAANIYIFSEAVNMWRVYDWNCQPVDFSNSPVALNHAWTFYLYFLNKISDLFDTIFFVLRKKDSQVTFLHVYHHSMMPLLTWYMTKYFPGGHTTFVGLLNTFVHILLYGYYYLASLGPHVQKYLWWKKYITKLQLLQFCLVFVHNSQLFFFDCGFPKWTSLLILPNSIFFFYLFNDFYHKSYNVSKIAGKRTESAKKK